ncbi:ankyrin repeat domain-containing protein 53 [Ahaetulla prasina]|uniref:ankyrin repeat domain-containing protein 53 n=1 Tax=Ahaetulla prasina TaxID=499056 RepID=UPI0026496F2D|nr:ankyrin repeat domain-containing protein 53 [Ahaetulla prasina]
MVVGPRLRLPGRSPPKSRGSRRVATSSALALTTVSFRPPPSQTQPLPTLHQPFTKERRGRGGGANSLSALYFSNVKTQSSRHAHPKHAQDSHYAASTGQTQWLQITLQKAETPNQADINGFSTLHTAALHGRLDCMKMLIEKYNLDINMASLRGWRPIHLVLGQESKAMAVECLQYLLSKGADVNVQNYNGVSPLHKAASEGRENCLQVLIDAGANVHAHDNEGQKPIDLCKMWGYRACAKRLSHAMWKAKKKNQLQQMGKLESIKAVCEMKQRQFLEREQRELNICNMMAFESWLLKKGLPLPTRTVLDLSQVQRHSLTLRKLAGQLASPVPSLSALLRSSDSIHSMQRRYRRQRPWNLSTNLDSEPATSIFRPHLIRLGVEPEKLLQQDFTSFLFLFKDPFGDPVIQIDNIGRVYSVPDLPYEVLYQSLYPHTQTPRLEVPRDLRPVQIFNLKHRRRPGPEHWWTDQMALSLRVTLDPIFLSSLQSHISAYCSTEVLGPRTASLGSPKKTPSIQSEPSSP